MVKVAALRVLSLWLMKIRKQHLYRDICIVSLISPVLLLNG